MVCKQHYKNKAFESGWLPDLTLKTDPIIVFLLYRSWLPQWKESNFLVSVYWQNRHTLKQISLTFDFRFLKKLPTRLINKKGYALHSSNQYPFTKRVSLLLLLIWTLTVCIARVVLENPHGRIIIICELLLPRIKLKFYFEFIRVKPSTPLACI